MRPETSWGHNYFVQVCHNRLTSLPDELCNASSLVKLQLSNNKVVMAPTSYGLGSLVKLQLSHNQLVAA